MLEWLGEQILAQQLGTAVEAVIKDGEVRTYDMGGKASTLEMASAISKKL